MEGAPYPLSLKANQFPTLSRPASQLRLRRQLLESSRAAADHILNSILRRKVRREPAGALWPAFSRAGLAPDNLGSKSRSLS